MGAENVEKTPCYKIKLTHKDGQFQTLYFAQDSGLLLKVQAQSQTEAGKFSFDTYLSDYRQVDGLMLPFKCVVNMMNQTRIITVNEISHNLDFSLKEIEISAEVKLLLAAANIK